MSKERIRKAVMLDICVDLQYMYIMAPGRNRPCIITAARRMVPACVEPPDAVFRAMLSCLAIIEEEKRGPMNPPPEACIARMK